MKRAKTTVCTNAIIWTDKIIECVRTCFEGNVHRDIIDATYKVLNTWNMDGTSSRTNDKVPCNKNVVENIDENNDTDDNFSDDDKEESDDASSEVNNLCLFTNIDTSIDLLANQFENPLLNANVQIPLLEIKVYEIMSKQSFENKDFVKLRQRQRADLAESQAMVPVGPAWRHYKSANGHMCPSLDDGILLLLIALRSDNHMDGHRRLHLSSRADKP